jgi:hypothetical protein
MFRSGDHYFFNSKLTSRKVNGSEMLSEEIKKSTLLMCIRLLNNILFSANACNNDSEDV